MQRLFTALHHTPGSHLRDALQEGSADAKACLHVPRASIFPSFILFAWWSPLLLLVRIIFKIMMIAIYSISQPTVRVPNTCIEPVAPSISARLL
jgi:hypothetical protein